MVPRDVRALFSTNAAPESAQARKRHFLFFLACIVLAWTCCYFLRVFAGIAGEDLLHRNRALPTVTQVCISEQNGILVLPSFWLLLAIYYVIKGNATPVQLVTFSPTLILALLCLTIFVFLSFWLPWIPIRGMAGG